MITEQNLGQLEMYKFTERAIGMFVSVFLFNAGFCFLLPQFRHIIQCDTCAGTEWEAGSD